MTPTTVSGLPARVLRLAAISCITIAVLTIVVAVIAGSASLGLAFAAGLLLGVANNYLIGQMSAAAMPLGSSSLLRLATASAVVAGCAVVFGMTLTVGLSAGIAVSELALAGSAVMVAVRAS